jgi:hypothetical protein
MDKSSQRLDQFTLKAALQDAMRDLAAWGSTASSDVERVYVFGMLERLTALHRIVEHRIEQRDTPDEEKQWDNPVRAYLDLLEKSRQVRAGVVVGEHLSRLAARLAGKPDAPAQNNDKTAQGTESKATSRKPERGDPEVAKRATLARSSPNIPAQNMCEIFDREGVPILAKWQEAGFRTWSQAYKDSNYRSRIHILISKDRRRN